MLLNVRAKPRLTIALTTPIGTLLGIILGMMAIASPLPALARPAILSATSADSAINFRSRPSTNGVVAYQGRTNDRIEVLEDQIGDDGYIWYFVRLENSGAGGWVREDLIRFVEAQLPTAAPEPLNPVPSVALDTCRNAAFARLDTFRGDVSITGARTLDNGTYDVFWRQQSTSQTGLCSVNRRNELISIRTTPTSASANPGNPDPTGPEENLYRFRTDAYVVRLYQQSNQLRMNLREIASDTTVLSGALVERVDGDRVDVYLSAQDTYEYQVRVTPQQAYQLTIYEGDRRVYQQSGTGF